MDIRKLQRAIVDGLEDVKAQHIVVFNTEAMSPLFERVIIASGSSNRQTKALAASVRDAVRSRGMQVLRTEGEENGEWIIVDCGAAVAHIMQPGIRDYYRLEEIWGGKKVNVKMGDATKPGTLPAASQAGSGEAPAPRRKAAAPALAKPHARKTPARKAAPARSAPAKAAPTKRAAPAKSAPASRAPAKTAPSRATPAKAAPSRAAPAKAAPRRASPAKPAAGRTAASKTAARKAAPRKSSKA